MDNNYGISENTCYIFEYSFDVGIKTEGLKISDGKYIESDTYVARNFISYFLFSYYRVGKYLNCEPYKNPFQSPYHNFGEDPVLKLMLKSALSEDNRERTKTYFDNISPLLKNRECHNEKALKCLCEFMNVKMPEYESDLLNDIPISLYASQDKNRWFKYLKENVTPIKEKHEPIIAGGNVGLDNVNIVYKINSLLDLWLASLYILFNLNGTIKICRNCGKPFILYNQKNIIYCSYNGNKCREEGRRARERERYKNEKDRLYRNIKNKLDYRINMDFEYYSRWELIKKDFFKLFYINEDNPNFIKWLTQIDNLFRVNKNKPFELPEIDSI